MIPCQAITQTDLFTEAHHGYPPLCTDRRQRFAGVDAAGRVDAIQCQAARRRITANAHGGTVFGSRHTRR